MAQELQLLSGMGIGRFPGSVHLHPNERDCVVGMGQLIVIRDAVKPNEKAQRFLRGHNNTVTCIALSNSGEWIASGQKGKEPDILLWNFRTGEIVYKLQEHVNDIAHLAFSSDDRFLATISNPKLGSSKGDMFIWDMKTGNIVTQAKIGASSHVTWGMRTKAMETDNEFLATSKNADEVPMYYIVTANEDSGLVFWKMFPHNGHMMKEAASAGKLKRKFISFAWSTHRDQLFAGTTSGDVVAYDILENQPSSGTIPACSGGVLSIGIGKNKELYIGGGDGSLTVLVENEPDPNLQPPSTTVHMLVNDIDQHGNQELMRTEWLDEAQIYVDGGIQNMCMSKNKDFMLLSTLEGKVYATRIHGLDAVEVADYHYASVNVVASGPNDRFVTGSSDGSLRIWDSNSCRIQLKVQKEKKGTTVPFCTGVAMSNDLLLGAWSDGDITCHICQTGQLMWTLSDTHRGGVSRLELSRNEKFFASGGVQGEVKIWDLETTALLSTFKGHNEPVTSLSVFDDNLHLISCSRDKSMLTWDLKDEIRLTRHTQQRGGLNAACLSADQTVVLTCGAEKKINTWDLREMTPTYTMTPYFQQELLCMVVSEDGTLFAAAGKDETVSLYNYENKQLIAMGKGHSGDIKGLAFSSDQRKLISVATDGSVYVWTI